MSVDKIHPERIYYRYRCLPCASDEYLETPYQLKRCAVCGKMMYLISRKTGREILKKGGDQVG